MIRKFLLLAAAVGFLFAVSTHAQRPYHSQQYISDEAFKRGWKPDMTHKRPMRFVVDKSTTVQGHVAAGSNASVDYQPDSNGQNVALSVREESQQSQQSQ